MKSTQRIPEIFHENDTKEFPQAPASTQDVHRNTTGENANPEDTKTHIKLEDDTGEHTKDVEDRQSNMEFGNNNFNKLKRIL